MEQIPELSDNELSITINRRYQGDFEVSISYAGQYIKRYPLTQLVGTFLRCLLVRIPIFGLWMFSRSARIKMIEGAYHTAIDAFSKELRLDIGNVIFSGDR